MTCNLHGIRIRYLLSIIISPCTAAGQGEDNRARDLQMLFLSWPLRLQMRPILVKLTCLWRRRQRQMEPRRERSKVKLMDLYCKDPMNFLLLCFFTSNFTGHVYDLYFFVLDYKGHAASIYQLFWLNHDRDRRPVRSHGQCPPRHGNFFFPWMKDKIVILNLKFFKLIYLLWK